MPTNLRRLVALVLLALAAPAAWADGEADSVPAAALPAPIAFPLRIDAIEIRGTWITADSVVLRELPWKAGEVVEERAWKLGITRLWNTGIFSRVEARTELKEGQTVAVLELEDRITLNPLLRYGIGGGVGWFGVGLNDTNLAGRFLDVAALYQRFGAYNGGQMWLHDPRLLGQRLDGWFQAEWLYRPRPTYVLRRADVRFEASVEVRDRSRFGFRLDLVDDDPQTFTGATEPAPAKSRGLVGGPWARFGRVDVDRLRQTGFQLEVRSSLARITDPTTPVFAQLTSEFTGFLELGERWNLALRVQLGHSLAAPAQYRFHLGGLDMVRGYPDNHVRTLAYGLFNAEARFVAFDSTWFAVMPAAFVDAATGPMEQGGAFTLASAGAGVRLLIPRFVKTGTRIDFAAPLERPFRPGLSLGVYQFF